MSKLKCTCVLCRAFGFHVGQDDEKENENENPKLKNNGVDVPTVRAPKPVGK